MCRLCLISSIFSSEIGSAGKKDLEMYRLVQVTFFFLLKCISGMLVGQHRFTTNTPFIVQVSVGDQGSKENSQAFPDQTSRSVK